MNHRRVSAVGKIHSQLEIIFFALMAASLAACGSGGTGGTGGTIAVLTSPTPPPTAPPNGLRVYASNAGTGGNNPIDIIPLPMTKASYSVGVFWAGEGGMTFDTTQRLFVGAACAASNFGGVGVFTQPIGNGASPAFCVPTSFGPTDVRINSAGEMFVSGNRICYPQVCGYISKFSPPLTSSSTPAFTIKIGPYNEIDHLAIDSNGDLFASLRTGSGVLEFTPPITAGSTPTQISGVSMPTFDNAGNMYALTSTGIGVFRPPFSATMTPVFTIKDIPPAEYSLAIDSTGNLYVAAGTAIWMYAAPLSSSSTPAVTLTTSAYGGLAIGP